MEREIAEADRIVTILTPPYARRANARAAGGVSYEHGMVTGLLLGGESDRLVHVLRAGSYNIVDPDCGIPRAFWGRHAVDFRDDSVFEAALHELWSELVGVPALQPPPIASPSETNVQRQEQVSVALAAGTPVPAPALVQAFVQSSLATQVAELATTVSSDTLHDVEEMRQRWREGRRAEVRQWLRRFDEGPQLLTVLSPAVIAKVLRFHAGLLLEMAQDIPHAAELIDEARQLDPSDDDARIRALLAWRRGSLENALAILDRVAQTSRAELNLRAGLLLEAGKPEQALETLSVDGDRHGLIPSDQPSEVAVIESYRLRALAALAHHDLIASRVELNRALSLAPGWDSLRYLDGVLKYYGALVPAALPKQIQPWPQPIEPAFVRRDAAAQADIQNALTTFDRLLERDRDDEERRQLEAWRLACAANLTGAQAAATSYAEKILAEDPAHPYVIVWAAHRGFAIDLTRNLSALRARVENNGGVADAVTLTSAYLATGNPRDAAGLLEALRERFADTGDLDVWRYWRAHAALVLGDSATVETIEAQLPPEPRRALRAAKLEFEAASEGSVEALLEHLLESHRETGEARYLFEAAMLHARRGDWPEVARLAGPLIQQMDTTETRRLAAFAYYNTKAFDRCYEIVASILAQATGELMLAEFHRLGAAALAALGRLTEAIRDLRAIPDAQRTTQDMIATARLYALQGDFHAVAVLASELRDQADLNSENALGLAEIVAHVDRELARTLWRVAVDRAPPDEVVARALTLGMQLGLDAETASLSARMAELAQLGRGGIQAFSLDELLAKAEGWRAHQEEVLNRYSRGEIPIHVVAGELNWSLVRLYHSMLEEHSAAPNPLSDFVLRARHGGRAAPGPEPGIQAGQLCLDVTALLLAEHLGILDATEKVFAPLYVPFGVMQFFLEERERLAPHQPSRLETDEQLLAAEQRGFVAVRRDPLPQVSEAEINRAQAWAEWVALLELAIQEGAYVLDLPLKDETSHGRPLDVAGPDRLARIVTPRAILDALLRDGHITKERRDKALSRLGSTGQPSDSGQGDEAPPRGAALYALHGGVDAIAEVGLLQALGENFRVTVEQKDQAERQATREAYASLARAQSWLDTLIHRVREGLVRGTFRQLPKRVMSDEPAHMTTPVRLLSQFLSPGEDLPGALWVDDRFLNQFRVAGRSRIVDILEVIAGLERAGALNEREAVALRHELRRANVRYIPPTAHEIVLQLEAAPLSQYQVVETPALVSLRQSVAAAIQDRTSLQIPIRPGASPEGLGELPYLLAVSRSATDGITEVWRRTQGASSGIEDAAQIASARAAWIAENVLLDVGLLRAAVVSPETAPTIDVSATGLAALLGYAITLLDTRPRDSQQPPDDDWAKRYLAWVWRMVVEPRLNIDPALRTAVVNRMRAYLTEPVDDRTDDPMIVSVRRLLAGRLYDVMPDSLKDDLSRDEALLDFAGREIKEVFGNEEHSFPAHEFVQAVTGALRGETTRLIDMQNVEVMIEPAVPPGVFRLRATGTDKVGVVTDPGFLALADDMDKRLTSVTLLKSELDLPPADEEQLMQVIRNEPSARARLDLVNRKRSESLRVRYKRLERELRDTGRFKFDDLEPPNVSAAMLHLRLPEGPGRNDLPRRFEQAAIALIQQAGVEEAFVRLSGIPIQLPDPIRAALAGLDERTRRQLIKRGLRRATSAIGFIQGVRLLADLAAIDPALGRLARRLALRLQTDPWTHEVAVFKELLSNAFERLERRPAENPNDVVALITAWYHAHRVTQAFLGARGDPAPLARVLSKLPKGEWTSYFARERIAWRDIAHPRQVRSTRLALAGIAYVLGSSSAKAVAHEMLSSTLTERLTVTTGEHRLPVADLLLDTTRFENALSSFLVFDDVGPRSSLEQAGLPIWSGLPQKERMADEAVTTLEQRADDLGPWLTLYLVAGDVPTDAAFEARLLDVLRKIDLVTLQSTFGPQASLPITLTCWVIARSGTASDRENVLGQLTRVAAMEAGSPGGNASGRARRQGGTVANAILDGAYVLSRAEETPRDAVQTFGRVIRTFAKADQTWWARLRPALESLVRGLPITLAHWLMPVLVEARAATGLQDVMPDLDDSDQE